MKATPSEIAAGTIQPPKFLDQVRHVVRTKHYSRRTEDDYVGWIHRFILFHQKRHPQEMGPEEMAQFLTHLAVNHHVAASTQNQALNALLFLYREVLKVEVDDFGKHVIWAKKPKKLPEVFSPEEATAVLSNLEGVYWMVAVLMYGAGLRLIECLRLRVKDIDFDGKKLTVREGKGQKDRLTVLPRAAVAPLQEHLGNVK